MCSICRSYPCLSGCPNAPDPPSIGDCEYCREPIFVGDEYAEIDGEKYHKECLDEFSTSDWLEKLGESIKEAELDEPDYDDYDD